MPNKYLLDLTSNNYGICTFGKVWILSIYHKLVDNWLFSMISTITWHPGWPQYIGFYLTRLYFHILASDHRFDNQLFLGLILQISQLLPECRLSQYENSTKGWFITKALNNTWHIIPHCSIHLPIIKQPSMLFSSDLCSALYYWAVWSHNRFSIARQHIPFSMVSFNMHFCTNRRRGKSLIELT